MTLSELIKKWVEEGLENAEYREIEFCKVDNQPILAMAYKGTGVCSQRCEKEREHKIEQEEFLQP